MAMTQERLVEEFSSIEGTEQAIEALKKEQVALASDRVAVENKLLYARGRIDSAKQNLERGVGSEPALREAQAAVAELRERLARIQDRQAQIEAEVHGLSTKLQALETAGADLAEALDHERQLAAANEKVSRLQSLIAEHEQRLQVPDNDDSELESLQNQREDLLAAIATGEGDPKALDNLDAKIEALLADKDGRQAQKSEEFRTVRQTITGLQKQLQAAEAELARLTKASAHVLAQYLSAELTAAARQYNETAQKLAQQFKRVQVLSDLRERVPGGRVVGTISRGAWDEAVIPLAKLPGIEDPKECHDADGRIIFSARSAHVRGEFQKDRESAKSHLKQAGLHRLADLI